MTSAPPAHRADPGAAPGGAAEPAVEVVDLVKRYPRSPRNAVDGISFAVRPGEVLGLLGPNGAGKTTTVGVLTTRVRASSGSARVGGVDVRRDPSEARRRLAVVPQRPNLDRVLTARQNLVFSAGYHGVRRAERHRRADELLERFGLGDRGGDKVDKYSGGQAQRLMIARALMHDPQVLFLDEPSTGLDPQARLFVWERVAELSAAGTTVVLTTHDMDEAEEVCDRVGVVDHGELLALDTPAALVAEHSSGGSIEVVVTPPDGARRPRGSEEADDVGTAVAEATARVRGVTAVDRLPGPAPTSRLRLSVDGDPAAHLAPVAEAVSATGALITDVRLGRPDLEDVFLALTGRELR
ncbi:ABC transporter ATP-binding protein [uncultured Pseudokineococcus sp.]|uniref:ABC transporter ATP-binding protein n=1 Tax=uncultured Pseudokineococcus sp. TaxID=1642928 RepID=UPI00260DFAAD|nr:ABC transporter ATP-binding protein [uncultured Pseudokineococcus sp.]